ncbi:MAG TPA: GntR family transcriptional regulator [Solirubrobacterales bacterium]|nr:GntR family transcriptional regulator [Solirubrobacterales bacterium]
MTAQAERPPRGRPSLVDRAEETLRDWLGAGRYRPGDRLPPEQELSGQLGISRGTLRGALQRLEASGEIIRRQGSGTFVGHLAPHALEEGLEALVPYSDLAERQGVDLKLKELTIEERPLESELAELFGADPGQRAVTFERVLLLDGVPGAHMVDVVRPGVALPAQARLRSALRGGKMVLDVLLAQGIVVSFARAHIKPALIRGSERIGKALQVSGTTAALELRYEMCTGVGEIVQYSVDTFLPGGLDLHIMRALDERPPVPAIDRTVIPVADGAGDV